MNKYPLVSVIIPNYNHARYLDQRIQTVLNQTYQNFEVIILDDKSTDNSLEVIAKYKDNPQVSHVVVNEENSGNTFKQWKRGFALAKGELIWIAESDDWCELNMLEELVAAYIKCPNCVISFTTHVLVAGGEEVSRNKIRKTHWYKGRSFIVRYMSLSNGICNASTAIFRQEALRTVSDDYMTYKGAGDYLFWTQIAEQGNVTLVSKNLSYFRRNSSTVTNMNFASGVASNEDWSVLSYIDSKYHLSGFRKNLAFCNHALLFGNETFHSEEIKKNVYSRWRIGLLPNQKLYEKYLYIQSVVKKHFGILI